MQYSEFRFHNHRPKLKTGDGVFQPHLSRYVLLNVFAERTFVNAFLLPFCLDIMLEKTIYGELFSKIKILPLFFLQLASQEPKLIEPEILELSSVLDWNSKRLKSMFCVQSSFFLRLEHSELISLSEGFEQLADLVSELKTRVECSETL